MPGTHAALWGRVRCFARSLPELMLFANQKTTFCDALRLFKLGYSWGGPISLVVPYELETMRSGWPEHLLRGTLVRFSVGLEDVADLQADIAQALEVLR